MGIIITIIVVVVVLAIIAWIVSTYNKLVRLRTNVEEGFSTMDVYLKQRWDLVPNLVETVKGYAKQEEKVLTEIVELRNQGSKGNLSTNEKVELNNQLTSKVNGLLALAEAYPDLKSNQNFLDLSQKLAGLEEHIANARKYYNGAVKGLNNTVQMFPSNIVANIFGFEKAAMFEASNEERNNVKVQF
jgi:LemA protein